jgi:hypothetical protein
MIRERVLSDRGWPFQDVLSESMVRQVLRDTGTRWRLCGWSPEVTLSAFLTQVLSPDHSCRDVVSKLRVQQLAAGQMPVSPGTAAYCKARQRLPEELPRELFRRAGQELDRCVARPQEFLSGRLIRLVDGTTVSRPDTPANQRAWPQLAAQKPGVGFPIARVVALLSYHSGAVREIAIAPDAGKETGETALLRQLFDQLNSGEILVGDTDFGNWWTIAMLQARGVDVVVPLHQHRTCDFRRGQRLNADDHVVDWCKPSRPEWMEEVTWSALPEFLTVHELRVHSDDPTTRVDHVTLVTTLLDPTVAPKDQVSGLPLALGR